MSDDMRIGVFGGTFDPVHSAHIDIARTALKSASLDRMLFVVSARPPHKGQTTFASAEDRYAMVELAVAGESQMEASRLELERPGPSYIIDTLSDVHKKFAGACLYLVLGMDSLVDLPHWRDPAGIVARARILAVPRPGHWVVPRELENHYELLPFHETELSSTEVRRRIASHERLDNVLPAAVQRFMRERGIYNVRIQHNPS